MFTQDFIKELLKTHHQTNVNAITPVSFNSLRLLQDMDRKKICFFGQLTLNVGASSRYLIKNTIGALNICTMFQGRMQYVLKTIDQHANNNQHTVIAPNHLFDDIYAFSDTFFQGAHLPPNTLLTNGSTASKAWSLTIGMDGADAPPTHPVFHFVGYKISY